jgi:probable rRNA maturation factor
MAAFHLSVQYATVRAAPSRQQVRRWVAAALAALPGAIREATLTVRFVDEAEGGSLNRAFRGKDHPTNVLTFPLSDDPKAIEADIVVCQPVVEREARAQGKDTHDHTGHLVVHGALHAAGYDHEHPREAEAMEALETAILARFRIGDPYTS